MKNFCFVIACLLACATAASAADDLVADPSGGVKYNAEERVINLPQDQNQWYVSLFGDTADPRFRELQGWFQNHAGLKHLRGQVHWNVYATDSVRYKRRYAKSMPGLPCVRVQTHQGVTASEFWGDYIPMTADGLYNGIRGDISDKASWGCLRRRRCRPSPDNEPCPVPTPEPEPVEPDNGQKPILPPEVTPAPMSGLPPWWLLIGLAVTGAGAGVAAQWKETYYPAKKVARRRLTHVLHFHTLRFQKITPPYHEVSK